MSDISCKHPLKGFQVGLTDNGKPKYKITSYDIDYVSVRGKDIACSQGKPTFVPGWHNITDFVEIPCGHCISCRLRYSKDWANRMMLEAREHEHNFFLTLTYDPEHLPDALDCIDPETGEIQVSPVHPLVKRDIQLFMKRLRKHYSYQKIRFYACGEYGSINMRPHYHMILFGLDIDDLVPNGKNELGQQYYTSETILKLWNKGMIQLAEVTWETCAYTARYVTKKLNGEQAEIYERYNFPREWSLCSRKPGIARSYYDDNKEQIYENQEIFLNLGDKGGRKIRPPKYYDRLFDIDYPDDMAIIKDKRKEIAETNMRLRSSLSSLTYQQQLAVDELNLNAKTKILKRKDL